MRAGLFAACVFIAVGCGETAQDVRAKGQPALGSLEPTLQLQTEPPPLTEQQRQQLSIFQSIVLNPSADIPAATRRGAVEELLSMGASEAVDVVAEGLRSGDARILVPIADVLANQPRPISGLLTAAVDALRTAPPRAADNLAAVVTRYGTNGLNAVAVVATDKTVPVEERLGPIQALGRFSTREAVVRLMPLLDEVRDEPAEVVSATCEALARVTGQPFGNEVVRWRTWWADAQKLNQQEWLAEQVERLASQLLSMEDQLQREEQRARDVERRLSGAYRDLFPALQYDQQIARLPALLEDDLAAVREFAIGRIDRLLRDTVAIPPELQAQLAARLDDPQPGLRLKAARLLDELTYPEVADRVAQRLEAETDPDVARGYLAILAKWPRVTALEAVRARLGDPAFVREATSALWSLALDTPLADPDPTRDAVRTALAASSDQETAAALTRLLVFIGTQDDITTLSAQLDGDDAELRRHVADGLSRRGIRQPLIDRAADPVIYPFVLSAVRSGPHDTDSIQTLVRLVPPDDQRDAWIETVIAMTSELSVEDLLTVDDLLQAMDTPELALRDSVLERAITTSDGTLEPVQRQQVLIRLAPVLFALGRAGEAHDLLEVGEGIDRPAALTRLHVQSALRTGAYERAAELAPDAAVWIEALATMVDDPGAVWALRDEIDRRFPDLTDEAARSRLDQLTATLPPRPAGDGSATAAGTSDAGTSQ